MDMNDKCIKKLLKKARSNPRTLQMLNNLKQSLTTETGDGDARTKLHQKMKHLQQLRSGKCSLSSGMAKTSSVSTEKVKIETTATKTLSNIKTLKKTRTNKLRNLQRKYGVISLEQYTNAMKNINDDKFTLEQKRHEQNIVDLYIKQHPCQTEHIENIDDDDDDDSPLVDLEKS